MDDLTKGLIAMAAAIVVAVLSGGTMGAAMIAISKKVVTSIVDQNKTLTTAIHEHTTAVNELTQIIKTDMAVKVEHEKAEWDLLKGVEQAANNSTSYSKAVYDKLKGRL